MLVLRTASIFVFLNKSPVYNGSYKSVVIKCGWGKTNSFCTFDTSIERRKASNTFVYTDIDMKNELVATRVKYVLQFVIYKLFATWCALCNEREKWGTHNHLYFYRINKNLMLETWKLHSRLKVKVTLSILTGRNLMYLKWTFKG